MLIKPLVELRPQRHCTDEQMRIVSTIAMGEPRGRQAARAEHHVFCKTIVAGAKTRIGGPFARLGRLADWRSLRPQ
jgi:hypothetical protein